MAFGADFNGDVGLGGAGLDDGAASALNGSLLIFGMDSFLHWYKSPQSNAALIVQMHSYKTQREVYHSNAGIASFFYLPAHDIGNAVGNLAHGFEGLADDALDSAVFRHNDADGASADQKSHTHAYDKVSFIHFVDLPTVYLQLSALLLCAFFGRFFIDTDM